MTNSAPVPQSSILGRQVSSIPLIILLWTAATPFTPASWALGAFSGAMIIDRFIAGLALVCACYFQWKLTSLTHPIAVAIPNPLSGGGQSEQYIYNGRVRYRNPDYKAGGTSAEIVAFYHPQRYWQYAAIEAGVLLAAEFLPWELLRRVLVLGVVGGLWAIGWMVTPQATKNWAWGHIKIFWFYVVWDLVREVGFGGGSGGRRRGRRG